MRRSCSIATGLALVFAAGFAIARAAGVTPPVVIGTSTGMTATGSSSTQSSTPRGSGPITTAPTPFGTSASLAITSLRAGARPVALRLTLRYPMQCGDPGAGLLVVRLPAQEQVPTSLRAGATLLDGRSVHATLSARHEIRVGLPQRTRASCDVISEGTVELVLTHAASLGNPVRAGTYGVSAAVGARSFATAFHVAG